MEIQSVSLINGIVLYLSGIGGLLGTLICIGILINIFITIHSQNTKSHKNIHDKQKKSKPTNKTVYILFIILLCLSIISNAGHTFLRVNIITRIDVTTFILTQCILGHITAFGFGVASRIFLYIIFLYRIQIVFKGSAYDYHPLLYRIGYGFG